MAIQFQHSLKSYLKFDLIPALALVLAIAATSCSNSPPANAPAAQPPAVPTTNGWYQVDISADFASTHLRYTAHWDIDKNSCSLASSGALVDVDAWNRLVTLTNAAVQAPVAATESCVDASDLCPIGKSISDRVDVEMQDGSRRSLIYASGNYRELCSRVADRALIKNLVQMLNDVVLTAGTSECKTMPPRCP